MSFIAEASMVVPFSPEAVFDRMADHPTWVDWMPKSFRPSGKSAGTLRVGGTLMVKIAGIPMSLPIKVRLLDRPREIAWGGGSVLLKGHHRFLFHPVEEGGKTQTKIISSEEWSGLFAPLLKLVVKPMAERVGLEQIQGLADSLKAKG